MSEKETWKPVVGFEGLYEVSDLGRVRSLDRIVKQWNRHAWIEREFLGVILKPRSLNGYASYILYKEGENRSATGHVLVAEAFIGPRPSGFQVCHYNGVRNDNRLDNLRYDTPKANSQDTIRHGRQVRPQGEKHGMSKFTAHEVELMRKYSAKGVSQTDIACMFNTAQGTVSAIVRKKSWAHI